jgi:hypothetical protein
MTRLGATGLAAVLVVLVASGCGSTKAGGITKAQYIARANAVCRAYEAKRVALSASANTLRIAVSEVNLAQQQSDVQLQAIPKPASDPVPSEWLHWRQLATADTRKVLDTQPGSAANKAAGSAEQTDREKARALAKAYGLTVCARS